MGSITATWQERAAAKRESIAANIPQEWRLDPGVVQKSSQQRDISGSYIETFLDQETVDITRFDSLEIVAAIQSRRYSASQVTTAFCRRAAVAQQIGNCLLEFFPDIALARAKVLDDYFAQHGRPMGPLHGLPVSLKDQFHVKGVDATMGYVGWIGGNLGVSVDKTHCTESQSVTELLALGAVLYCKTTVPQTLMRIETENNITGITKSPLNTLLSSGGSSGGEGALLGLRGSSVGLGTDIGGSVRVPAAACGVFSLKPTPERLSYRNMANTHPGEVVHRSAVGIMSSSLGGLELVFRSLLSAEPWLNDPIVVPMPWRQDSVDSLIDWTGKPKRPLKIGILHNDGMVTPHPPIQRGIKAVEDALKRAGHTVFPWQPPSAEGLALDYLMMCTSDGNIDIHNHLARSGEPLIEITRPLLGQRDPMPILEFETKTLEVFDYADRYNQYWNSTGQEDGRVADAYISPVAPHTANIPEKVFHVGYTQVVNALNYSAAVFPVSRADKAVDQADSDYTPMNDADRMNWEAYEADIYHGAPIGAQVVTRKFQEEKALVIARIIHESLGSPRIV